MNLHIQMKSHLQSNFLKYQMLIDLFLIQVGMNKSKLPLIKTKFERLRNLKN